MRPTEFKQYINEIWVDKRPLTLDDVHLIWAHSRGDMLETHERNIEGIWELLSNIVECLRQNNLSVNLVTKAKYDPEQEKLKIYNK